MFYLYVYFTKEFQEYYSSFIWFYCPSEPTSFFLAWSSLGRQFFLNIRFEPCWFHLWYFFYFHFLLFIIRRCVHRDWNSHVCRLCTGTRQQRLCVGRSIDMVLAVCNNTDWSGLEIDRCGTRSLQLIEVQAHRTTLILGNQFSRFARQTPSHTL